MLQILAESLSELNECIRLFASSPSSSPKLLSNLQLTGAYSTLVQAYVALQDPDDTEEIKLMLACHKNLLRITKGYKPSNDISWYRLVSSALLL